MTRIVLHSAHGPQAVPKATAPGDNLYACRCGLSANAFGLCDGSHKATLDEQPGLTYLYERKEGKLQRIVLPFTPVSPPSANPQAPEAPIQA
jgi:CDGSH iron-sulfur domain-containing protein 1